MTLNSGQVNCAVSSNIRQEQYEKMIGYVEPYCRSAPFVFMPTTSLQSLHYFYCFRIKANMINHHRPIAFHPASVIFETSNHAELIEKVGVRSLVSDTIDELLRVASAQSCKFSSNFKELTIESMTRSSETPSTMYQDYMSRRPMEVETFLGSPMKFAQENSVAVPRIETLYALLHNLNTINQTRPPPGTPQPNPQGRAPPPRISSVPAGVIMANGPMKGPMPGPMRNGSRAPSMTGPPPPMMRRGPPPGVNGYPPRAPNGHGGHTSTGPGLPSRGPSFEGNDLEEFSHLMLYEDIPEDALENVTSGSTYGDGNAQPSTADIAMRERELALRQRELALREQEYHMRRGGPRRPHPPPGAFQSNGGGTGPGSVAGFDDDDDDDGFIDPNGSHGPPPPMIDPDNFDMMSVTSRRTRKAPSASALRRNPEMNGQPPQSRRNPLSRPGAKQRRTSTRLMSDVPGLHESLMDNPLMAYSSNRYGNVDRQAMGQDSRTNSLTSARLDELQQGGIGGAGGYGAYPSMNRRVSGSPGNALGPPGRTGRPSPPNGFGGPHGNSYMNGSRKPSPPSGMRQPIPRHPPGHGNSVAPQQVEQRVGVSHLYPPKPRAQVRSLTGSASASAESGESGASAQLDSENSAHSSQSSLGPRQTISVR